ncbi:MAG TPA: hypothetical protein PK874_05180 [Desulfobacteraceae bacterium]|nr:hypothetical protein [Desulfobacteraceae bacterium]HPJ69047.1 hypothetical protein [Desulfobacteraceae bacterium]HPQ27623.1 hypothetical protein [Desulfobacteraceae bacterium]
MNISKICAAINELPLRKHWAILKSIEHPKHREFKPSSAFYQPFTSLLPAFGWLAGWLAGGFKPHIA